MYKKNLLVSFSPFHILLFSGILIFILKLGIIAECLIKIEGLKKIYGFMVHCAVERTPFPFNAGQGELIKFLINRK